MKFNSIISKVFNASFLISRNDVLYENIITQDKKHNEWKK